MMAVTTSSIVHPFAYGAFTVHDIILGHSQKAVPSQAWSSKGNPF